MTVVNDAVIVAAGLGSRMLPTSAYLPKESLPLVDVPAFIHLTREAVNAGVSRIHIITSPSKDFSTFLESKEHYHSLKPEISSTLFTLDESIKFFIHIQHEPLGLGHAILQSLDEIQGAYLVLLGDNIITDKIGFEICIIGNSATYKVIAKEVSSTQPLTYSGCEISLIRNSLPKKTDC